MFEFTIPKITRNFAKGSSERVKEICIHTLVFKVYKWSKLTLETEFHKEWDDINYKEKD